MSVLPTLSRLAGVRLSKPILTEAWQSYGTKFALGSWAAFGGSHLLLSSEPIRPKLINLAGGEEAYRMGYSFLQTAILGTVAWKYSHLTPQQRGPILLDRYRKESPWKMTSASLRILGVLAISEAFLTAIKNPLGMNSYFETIAPETQRDQQRKWQPFGLQRVSRHSLFFGYCLYALGMCMTARRTGCDLALWGLVPLFSIIGARHQEARIKKQKPWTATYFKETSMIPFGAYVRGEQSGSRITTEIPPSAYAAAFVMIGAIFFFVN